MRLAGKLRNVCPHIHDLRPTADEHGDPALEVRWAFETFLGTLSYYCMICGSEWSQYSVDMYCDDVMGSLARDIKGTGHRLLEQRKNASRLVQKLDRLGGLP